MKSRIVATEIKFMRKSLGYKGTDYKRNTEMLNKFKTASVIEEINVHKSNWEKPYEQSTTY